MTKRRSLRILGDDPWAREIADWIAVDSAVQRDFDFLGCVSASPLSSLSCNPGDHFVMGLLDPREKLEAVDYVRTRGGLFINALHPSSIVSLRARLGQGVVIGARSVVSCDAFVGDNVTLQAESILGHDAQCGEGSTLSCRVDVTGFVRLGKGVWLGDHTTVSPRVELDDFVRVAPKSVVIRKVSKGLHIGGIPARTLRVASP